MATCHPSRDLRLQPTFSPPPSPDSNQRDEFSYIIALKLPRVRAHQLKTCGSRDRWYPSKRIRKPNGFAHAKRRRLEFWLPHRSCEGRHQHSRQSRSNSLVQTRTQRLLKRIDVSSHPLFANSRSPANDQVCWTTENYWNPVLLSHKRFSRGRNAHSFDE